MSPFGIHWFRRDLRIAGNQALQHNCQTHHGRVLGLFCFDSQFLSRSDFSHNRFAFFLDTLTQLKSEMKRSGGDLLVVDEVPEQALPRIIQQLQEKPAMISFNRDYEPFARSRDKKIEKILEDLKVPLHSERDHLIIEPQELQKNDGSFYQVYTPFRKKWLDLWQSQASSRTTSSTSGLSRLKSLEHDGSPEKIFSLKWNDVQKSRFIYKDSLKDFIQKNKSYVTVPIPEAGAREGWRQLKAFKKKLQNYEDDRNFPAIEGTSKISMFLKNGSLTSAQVIAYLDLEPKGSSGTYLNEIIWREFYYHILWHVPRVEKDAFLTKYKDISWKNNRSWFQRWCEGQTGYPIVDAGMRQLNETGWMHNRVRMIVASFLCKDLLIDWKWGENYFMKKLLDGDLACNNGGWQWAASTGCDPQPYFRIFNPVLQSQKFDPRGEYIRSYVKELQHIKDKSIHAPMNVSGYAKPIVNHSEQRMKALSLYKGI